ncbi:1-acyl-sn-glycerol-3-phosphate acyltransferase [Alteromonadaceae bacterium BrNp21-10]|nr:1-acyl-sn-glycerol-3-phosphate acyltransferase [Alteromonadaceae bacterium BrNp21-10]
MLKFLSFLLMAKVKILTHILYRGNKQWLSEEREESYKDVRLIVFLNHTSLFEPLFIRFSSWRLLWNVAHKVIVPGADVTMRRPLAGRMLKALLPGVIPISRKQDESWQYFLSMVGQDGVITAILPEGRMKRANGLDKAGKPMSVRGGVAEILEKLEQGKILFIYSGGLHHIQSPGDIFPKLFKCISANLEIIDIPTYKASLSAISGKNFKAKVMADMDQRLLDCVP